MGRKGTHMGYWWESHKERGLTDIGWGSIYYIHQAQGEDKWKALVNAVMKLRFP
jgi:hypothetical protein